MTAQDFNCTIARTLGVDFTKMGTPAPGGQLFSIGGKDTAPIKGVPITTLFG